VITIKLKNARELINQSNVDSLFYIDKVSNKDFPEIIFKNNLNNQLYAFHYHETNVPDLGTIIDTVQQFDAALDNDNNNNLDVEVTPVKKATKQITVTKYIEDNSND